jgi:hypothetical protein
VGERGQTFRGVGMKKPVAQQKKLKDVIEIPDDKPKSEVLETIDHITRTFIFKNKYGIPIFAMAIEDCDYDTMVKLINDYKRALDLKELMSISVLSFNKWLVDRGFVVNADAEYISWV